MFDYKITRVRQLHTFQSEKIGTNYNYLVYLHVYADQTHKAYYRIKFVLSFTAEDVCEYAEDDSNEGYLQNLVDFKNDYVVCMADSICSHNNIKDVIEISNNTINNYNC